MSSEIQIVDLAKNANTIYKYLISRWLLIIITSLVIGIGTVVIISLQEPSYTAEISFVSENDKQSSLSGYAGIAAQFGFDIGSGGGGAFEGDNLIGFLKSRKLVDKTLLSVSDSSTNQLMIDAYLKNHGYTKKWASNAILAKLQFGTTTNRLRDSVINLIGQKIIKKQLSVEKPDKKQDIVYIRFNDNSEIFAKQFVEILTNNAIEFYTNYKSKKSAANVSILQHQTDSVKRILFGAITDIAANNDFNVNPLKQSPRIGTQKKQVDLKVNSVLYEELLKNLELSKLALRKETPLIQIIDTPMLPLINEKMGRLTGGIIGFIVGGFFIVLMLSAICWLKLVFK